MTDYPDLADLALLVRVARTGSIGRAAAELVLPQPTVSRRMAALERRLGVRLLSRTTRGTTLTAPGRVVVDWAASLLAAADSFVSSVELLGDERQAGLRAALSMTVAEHYAPRWLTTLRDRHPGVIASITIANSTGVADLVRSGVVDVGVIESPQPPADLRRQRVGADRVTVAVVPDHPWAAAGRVGAAELATTPLLVREVGSGTRDTVERALHGAGLGMRVGLELASNTALKAAALQGLGPVVLSALSVQDEVARGQLVEVEVPGLSLTRPLTALSTPATDVSSGPVAALLAIARTGSDRGAEVLSRHRAPADTFVT